MVPAKSLIDCHIQLAVLPDGKHGGLCYCLGANGNDMSDLVRAGGHRTDKGSVRQLNLDEPFRGVPQHERAAPLYGEQPCVLPIKLIERVMD